VVKRLWDDDELAAEWTLEPNDQTLLANRAGPTRLGFAALFTFFRHEGRFPTSKHEVLAARRPAKSSTSSPSASATFCS
jgi:hypothetical protein